MYSYKQKSGDDLDHLSDAELRRRLQENGFPNMPITETTRHLLIKKLKNHLKSQPKRKGRSTMTSARNATEDKVNGGRSTVYAASPSPRAPLPTRSSINHNEGLEEHLSYSQRSPHINQRPALPKDVLPKMYVPPPTLASESEEDDYLNYSPPKTSPRICYPPRMSAETAASSPYSHTIQNGVSENFNPHFGMVSRLLSLRDITMRKPQMNHQGTANLSSPITYQNDESDNYRHQKLIKNNIRNGSGYAPKNWTSYFSNIFDFQSGFKQMVVPYALIFAFVTFFVVLAFMYIIVRPDLSRMIQENSTEYIDCQASEKTYNKDNSEIVCINDDQLGWAININKELSRILQDRAEHHYCNDQKQPEHITVAEFIQHLQKKDPTLNEQKILEDLEVAKYLIKSNPQWKIRIESLTPTLIDNDLEKKIDSLHLDIFVLAKKHRPLKCVLINKLQRFFVMIGTGAMVGLVSIIGYVVFCFFKRRRDERLKAINNFSTEIINHLLYCASISDGDEDCEVVANHLRDKLIPLNKRNTYLTSAWNEALRLLNANDSRIHFDFTSCNGEEFQTMKWIGGITKNVRDRSCSKQWQSSAFDNTNKISNPPTQCLKIRYMFDAAEANHPNLKDVIESAILDKVGSQCSIFDIQIDKQTCCVYVRCASEKDAGIMHNAINGWWFDKRLVSIKFLRLQRYLSRFPKSSTTPLSLPSKNTKICSVSPQLLKNHGVLSMES